MKRLILPLIPFFLFSCITNQNDNKQEIADEYLNKSDSKISCIDSCLFLQ